MFTPRHAGELLVLGNRAGSPGPDGPASGYLVSHAGGRLLIDCGPGIATGLAVRGLIGAVDAIIVTHRHADHSLDLTALAYHRAFPERLAPIPLYAPTGFGAYVSELDRAFGIPTLDELRTPIGTQFPLTEVEPGTGFTTAGLKITTVRAAHPVPCLSLGLPELGLVYTADTALTDDLITLANGADLLLAEATYPTPEGRDFTAHGHMSGFEAGRLARKAGVERLVLTHLSDFADAEPTLANARTEFAGTSWVCAVGESIPLGGHDGDHD